MIHPRVWIEKACQAKSSAWRVRWRERGGGIRSKSCKTKAIAEAVKADVYKKLLAGQLGQPVDILWDDFVKDELKAAETSMSRGGRNRLKSSLAAVTRHLKPRMVSDVAAYEQIERFVELRAKEPGKKNPNIQPETIVADLQYIHAALVRAKERQIIGSVPAMPTVRTWDKPPKILSPEQIQALMDAANCDRERLLVWLGVTTGRRLQDILHLQWEHVDMAAGVVWILQTEEHQTKAGRNAYAPIESRAIEILKRMHDALPKRVADGKAVPKCKYVFTTDDGLRRWKNNIHRVWYSLCERAELTGDQRPRIHDMKHTFCTGMVQAGIQQSIITAAADHKSPKTTMKYYQWVVDENRRTAASKLPWVIKDNQKPDQQAEGA